MCLCFQDRTVPRKFSLGINRESVPVILVILGAVFMLLGDVVGYTPFYAAWLPVFALGLILLLAGILVWLVAEKL